MPKVRLHKAIAAAGIASRRAAERLIAQGKVTVNGQVVTAMGTTVDPSRDLVRVDGQELPRLESRRYILLYKPREILCTRSDPQGRKTVYDLLPRELSYGLHSVGRLDYDAEGLLLLTDDGDLTQALTHPSRHVPKVYLVKFKGKVSPVAITKLRNGVALEDGDTLPTEVHPVEVKGAVSNSWLRIVLREGRRNQIKRMGDAVDHQVLRIIRIAVGPLKLPDQMGQGHYRPLKGSEVRALKRAADEAQGAERPSREGIGQKAAPSRRRVRPGSSRPQSKRPGQGKARGAGGKGTTTETGKRRG